MKTYIVTMENFDGECKRVRIASTSPEQAMADAQMGAWAVWYPVDVQLA